MTKIAPCAGPRRPAALTLLLIAGIALAGCSQDFLTADDVYVPNMAQERFPIRVVEQPVNLTVSAAGGDLRPGDVNAVIAFARQALENGAAHVSMSYPSGSSKAVAAARQTAAILAGQGIHRGMIHASRSKGAADTISLSFSRKVAATEPCGDWSSNTAATQLNEPYPSQGCAIQANTAAMVANPRDFEQPAAPAPVMASSRKAALDAYQSGAWTAPRTEEGFVE